MHKNTLFPIFLKTDQLRIIIIGGGKTATEKLHFLLKNSPSANVTILAPKIADEIISLINKHQYCKVFIKKYEKEIISTYNVIIAATNNAPLNKTIWQHAKQNKILINVADTPALCDFYLGAIVTKGDLKLAISTNGKSPIFAKKFRQVLEDVLPKELPTTLHNLHIIRKNLKGDFSKKVKFLHTLTKNLTSNHL